MNFHSAISPNSQIISFQGEKGRNYPSDFDPHQGSSKRHLRTFLNLMKFAGLALARNGFQGQADGPGGTNFFIFLGDLVIFISYRQFQRRILLPDSVHKAQKGKICARDLSRVCFRCQVEFEILATRKKNWHIDVYFT